MYHSITFGNKNTWDDWHLVPLTRPVFNPPKQKTNTIDIPGADSALDFSEALTGYPVYSDRVGSFTFVVMNGYKDWTDTYSDIMDYLHGNVLHAQLEDDPKYYYEGRFSIDSWESEPDRSKITISYIVKPYKFNIFTSIDDPDTSDIYKNIVVNTDVLTPIILNGSVGRMPICPIFQVAADANGIEVRLTNEYSSLDITNVFLTGDSQHPDFIITDLSSTALTKLWFKGHGTISVLFRSGRL